MFTVVKGVPAVLDGIPLDFAEVSGWGAFSLLALYNVLAFLKGWVFPKHVVDAFERQALVWKEAWEVGQVALREKDATVDELLLNSKTTVEVLRKLQEDSERENVSRQSYRATTAERTRRPATAKRPVQ